MISNKDPKLDEQLAKLWQASIERQTSAQAKKKNATYIDLTKAPIELESLALVTEERARAIKAAVFEKKGKLVALAALNPESAEVKLLIEDLKKENLDIKLFLVSEAGLEYAWSHYKFIEKERSGIASRVDVSPEEVLKLQKELTTLPKVGGALKALFDASNAVSVSAILEITLAGAMTNRASDVHFEPAEEGSRLRYRIDGVLNDVYIVPHENYQFVVNRIKLLSNLRINVKDISQDGRFTIGLGEVAIELRVSIIPSQYGETIVMRILDPRSIQIGIKDMGFRPDDMVIIERGLKAPNGMILNTGPTGSGKTTTLYAFLRSLANPETKIITIEDPIEYHLEGLEQTQVEPARGYTFANGLQAMMRQDPDIILVGEIRDKETAQIALQAALTGHLVFSTLHTNSASGVIPRLLDLGAQPVSIGPALTLIIAQRLVRKLCDKCKVKQQLDSELERKIKNFLNKLPARVDKKVYEEITLYIPFEKDDKAGCENCHFSGYRGRVGIFELLEMEDDMEVLIEKHAGEVEVQKVALSKGMVTLQQDGILKALRGQTSFAEVESITGPLKELEG